MSDSLHELLELWRAEPAPEVSDAIDRVSRALPRATGTWEGLAARGDAAALETLLARLVDDDPRPTRSAVLARLEHLARWPRDPRLSRALTDWLLSPPFTSLDSRPLWTLVFTLLEQLGDPRTRQRLEPVAPSYRAVIGTKAMGAWTEVRVKRLVRALPRATPVTTRTRDAIARLAPAAAQPAPRRPRTAEDLFAAVIAAPEDDAPRLVLADHWQERGDPRGEFVALQIARARGERGDPKREAELLAKHQADWLRPIADAVEPRYCVFERGFLASARIYGRVAAKVAATAGHPLWGTVHTAWEWKEAPAVLLHPVMTALRFLPAVNRRTFHVLVASPRPLPVEEVHAGIDWPSSKKGVTALLECPGLPRLRKLSLAWLGRHGRTDFLNHREVWSSPLVTRLEHLRFVGRYSFPQFLALVASASLKAPAQVTFCDPPAHPSDQPPDPAPRLEFHLRVGADDRLSALTIRATAPVRADSYPAWTGNTVMLEHCPGGVLTSVAFENIDEALQAHARRALGLPAPTA